MFLKALAISTIMFTLYAASKSMYAMSYAALHTGGSFGCGIHEARKKNRRNKIIRRQRSR